MNDSLDLEVLRSTDNDSLHFFRSYKAFKENQKNIPKKLLLESNLIEHENDINNIFLTSYRNDSAVQLYRARTDKNENYTSIWLSLLTQAYKDILVRNPLPSFKGISKQNLSEIAKMSSDLPNISLLPKVLYRMGIVLVYQRALPGTKVDGATFVLSSGNPVVGLSLRYGRIDSFWFTLLHELSHVHLHYERLTTPIIDDLDEVVDTEVEIQANRLAKFSFVDRKKWRTCEVRKFPSVQNLMIAARENEVHPAIIAGLVHNEKNDYSLFGKLVNKVDVRDLL